MEQEYAIEIKGLTKKYFRKTVLDNVSLEVEKGSIYGIVGKNGAGKTTLIRLLCNLQSPTLGTYSIFGADRKSKGIKNSRKRMGAMIESPAVYLDMSAKENLKQQALILGLPSFDSVNTVLEMVGLGDVGNKKVKHFSLGMKQRLGIAIALLGDPDVVILDEPINGLDPYGIIEIRELILKLNREKNTTFVICSHILSELNLIATHYCFLDKGKVVRRISAKELSAECKKSTRVTVSNSVALVRVLDEMGYDYKLLSEGEAEIYAETDLTSLAVALNGADCKLLSYKEQNETLESYFINLLGGV